MSNQPVHIQAFEVKFALAPNEVLNEHGAPVTAIADALGIVGSPEEYHVAFLDGPHLDFHTERWNVRFRDKGGEAEVSFKRRLPVYHDSVPGVLATALRQGFDAHEQAEGYEAEIEWGPVRRTLTLVKEKKLSGTSLPGTAADACAAAAAAMPGKLREWMRDDWASSVLAVGRLYGPVRARRWKWGAVGGKTAFEVWDLRSAGGEIEPVVEVSVKAPDEGQATAARESLRSLLAGQPGWLSAEDVLKTELVLDRYR